MPVTFDVKPPGARVFVRDYGDANAAWRELGPAPLTGVTIPRGMKTLAD